ncbi:MAG: hypothetical protein DHS20C15_27060 [Planctomycetota bacterium]|nr:MAG: hypothetical protein DHS20C15_27060 [Planctomycetota bacterium]
MVMGMEARLVLYAENEPWALSASREAFERLHELDAVFSNYREDSELSRLMATPVGERVQVSCELMQVLKSARFFHEASAGAFDVTAAPLFEVWREARAVGHPPEAADISAALSLSAADAFEVEAESGGLDFGRGHKPNCWVWFTKPVARVDLGGIAKGYACAKVVYELRRKGIESALLQIGGDVAVSAPPPGRGAWLIEVGCGEGPLPPARLAIADTSVSTSGDSEQHFVHEGVRYSHIVDPRSGQAMTDSFCVTVTSKRGEMADGLASSIRVLGLKAGAELLANEVLARVEPPRLFIDGQPWLTPSPEASPGPWLNLLDGDLDAWEAVDDGAPVDTPARALDPAMLGDDGVLAIPSTAPSGWIRTRADYRDFQLRFDVKLARMANGGLFLRAARDGSNPAYSGCEIQLLDDFNWEAETNSTLRDWQFTGSLYGAVPPGDRDAFGPIGTWNTVEVLFEDTRLAVMLNGRLLYDVDTHALDVSPAFAERAALGAIGLQRYAAPLVDGDTAVWVRHAFLREL